jgi:hypothetical protein
MAHIKGNKICPFLAGELPIIKTGIIEQSQGVLAFSLWKYRCNTHKHQVLLEILLVNRTLALKEKLLCTPVLALSYHRYYALVVEV